MSTIRGPVLTLIGVAGVLAMLVVLASADAAPGDLDPSFGEGGTVETRIGDSSGATGVAVQPDKKILVGGSSSPGGLTLARYEPDGRLDVTFGAGGVATGPSGRATALALQPDGKILLTANSSFRVMAVARYKPDGSLDGSFGSGGVVNGPGGWASALAVQQDGKIVVAGSESSGNLSSTFKLTRFNADGSLDTGFGSDGIVRTPMGFSGEAHAVTLQPDGRILAGGTSTPGVAPPPPPPPPAPPPPPPPGPPPRPKQIALARYNPDGSLDPTFGTNGIVTTEMGFQAQANGIALQPGGEIVAAGDTNNRFARPGIALARYRPDGSLDASFGSGGVVTTQLGSAASARAVALQPDGRIVVAGYGAVARYRPDGKLDKSFGSNGIATSGIVSTGAAEALALQQDGRILVAGSQGRDAHVTVSRYQATSPTTIRAKPKTVGYGRTASVTGTLTREQPGTVVRILKRGCYDTSTKVATRIATRSQRTWTVRLLPPSRTVYWAEVDGLTSTPLVVQVRPRMMLAKIGPQLFRARVLAAHSLGGDVAVLQRYSAKRGRWVDGRSVVLRRVGRRGSTIISGRTFHARTRPGERVRLLQRRIDTFACYAPAASTAIDG